MIDETTRCRNDNVGPAFQNLLLFSQTEPTNNLCEGDVCEGSKLLSNIETLDCKLAGWHEDRDTSGWDFLRAIQKSFEDRNDECCCLARASYCTNHYIFTEKGDWYSLCLNWCRFGEADCRKAFENWP